MPPVISFEIPWLRWPGRFWDSKKSCSSAAPGAGVRYLAIATDASAEALEELRALGHIE
jgi:hypothetical protein